MIEAGAPSTEEVVAVHGVMPTPTGRGRKAKDRVLRGSLALDALHLLARDVDRAGELVGLEHPAFDHILNRRRSEAEILGRFPYGDFLAVFVCHPNTTFPPGKDWGLDTPQRIHRPFYVRTSENPPSETVRKGVRATLRGWIWPL